MTSLNKLELELDTILDAMVGLNDDIEHPYDALRSWQSKLKLALTETEIKRTTPIMVVNLKDVEAPLSVYLKLLEEAENWGISKSSCKFTWIDDSLQQKENDQNTEVLR